MSGFRPTGLREQVLLTGLSLANPGSAAVEVRVDALARDGQAIGMYHRVLQPGETHVGLLFEWIPATQGHADGRIQVRSAAPFAVVQIFGTDSLSAMEAVRR